MPRKVLNVLSLYEVQNLNFNLNYTPKFDGCLHRKAKIEYIVINVKRIFL